MKASLIAGLGLTLTLASAAQAQDPSPTCDELVWSAQVLAANPDIKQSCLGVYERGDTLYARSEIELTRVRGNRLTFRPMHRDGSKGRARSITVPSTWRAEIKGRSYRAGELLPGQRLNVFIPEDRIPALQPARRRPRPAGAGRGSHAVSPPQNVTFAPIRTMI